MPRKQKKYHYIYKTTCTITGKFYVGMHSTDNLEDGYLGSGKILGYSRRKYGDENHVREILEMLPSREALKAREKEIVNEELLADPLNINLKYGGDGGGRLWNEQHAKKFHFAGWQAMMKIVNSSEEIKQRRAVKFSKTFKKNHASGNHEKSSAQHWIGRKHSEETKQKLRKSKNAGEANGNFGKRNALINNGEMNKRVPLDQLESYLFCGWKKGMI